jgi:hypothetical protein
MRTPTSGPPPCSVAVPSFILPMLRILRDTRPAGRMQTHELTGVDTDEGAAPGSHVALDDQQIDLTVAL